MRHHVADSGCMQFTNGPGMSLLTHLASSADALPATVGDVEARLLSSITEALSGPAIALETRGHPGDDSLPGSGREALLTGTTSLRRRRSFSSEQLHLKTRSSCYWMQRD